MKIAISYVSGANATLNLSTEAGTSNFDAVHTAASGAWNARLNAVQVAGASEAEKTKFYTALYHSLLHPNVFSDVNGDYMGFDKTTHTATGELSTRTTRAGTSTGRRFSSSRSSSRTSPAISWRRSSMTRRRAATS